MTFEEILTEYGIPIAPEGHEHTRPGWVQFDCPFCSRDTAHYRMGYNKAYGYTSCWLCGPSKTVNVLVELLGISYHAAKLLLADIEQTTDTLPTPKQGKLILPNGRKPLTVCPQHQRYLQGRGYDWRALAQLWRLEGIQIAERLSWRVFIPIHYHGVVVSWTTRTISDNPDTLRYISASVDEEAIGHKTLLYGEDYATHAIAIQEGPTGVWRIGPGAVATCGVGFGQAQVLKMARYPVRCVCFDAEPEAQKRAKRLVDALMDFPGETFNVVWGGGKKDAGEASQREIDRLRREVLA